jgi:opacity protein-like surface antigen
MKRILGVLLLVGVMAMPTVASSAEQIGVYVAPKFVYGLTQMDGAKGHWSDGGDSESIRIGSKTDDAFGGSLAIGYDFDKRFGVPIRAELEYAGFSKVEAKRSYSVDPTDSAKMKQTFGIQTLFVNAYWDINTGTQFTPYLGAGLGMAFINTKFTDKGDDTIEGPWNESTGSKNVTNFAWNVGAGLGYDFTENWTLDVGYRFVGLGSVKTKSYSDDDYKMYGKTDNLYQHQFAVGIRYTF